MSKIKKYFFPLFVSAILLALATPAFLQSLQGQWTPNNWLYKMALGEKGAPVKTAFDTGLNQVDARLAKEIWLGDPNYGTTLSATLIAIGASPAILRVPAGTYTIAANLTIPANVVLKPENGALFSIASGSVLTINGPLDAESYQIFTGAGAVNLAGPIPFAYPEWWGTGAGAFQAAHNSGIHKLLLTQSLYQISNGITITNPCFEICGAGPAITPEASNTPSTVTIQATASMDKMIYVNNDTGSDGFGFHIRNVKLEGNSLANYGLYLYNTPYWTSEGVAYSNCLQWGLWGAGTSATLAWSARVRDNYFWQCANGCYLVADNDMVEGNIFEKITGTALSADYIAATQTGSTTFVARGNKFDKCATPNIWVKKSWQAECSNNYFETAPAGTSPGTIMTHIRYGSLTDGTGVYGGSIHDNMFSFEWDTPLIANPNNIAIDLAQGCNINIFGNFAGSACGYLIKTTGGSGYNSTAGVNYLVNSSTTYLDSIYGYASVMDNNGNILTPMTITPWGQVLKLTGGGNLSVWSGGGTGLSTYIWQGWNGSESYPRSFCTVQGEVHAGGNGSSEAPVVINGDGSLAALSNPISNPLTLTYSGQALVLNNGGNLAVTGTSPSTYIWQGYESGDTYPRSFMTVAGALYGAGTGTAQAPLILGADGSFHPGSLADSAAANNSLYYSTTQSKLAYKDPSGTVHTLY